VSTRGVKQAAVPQLLLFAGDRLQMGADADVQLVVLSDLHKERLKPAGEVTVRRQGCEPADAVRKRDPSILMTFVRLPKGTFYMGWDGVNKGTKTEIKEDFEIAVHTVTQGQWQAVMGNNPSHFSRRGAGSRKVEDISDEELKLFPVECVSWEDARAFLRRLNESEHGHGFTYRWPSSAEWEYACRAGANSEEECSYLFYSPRPTNQLTWAQANFSGTWSDPSAGPLGRPARVGAYPPNKLGLCEMHGNVWQMCVTSGGFIAPYRGGAWTSYDFECAASFRKSDSPTARFANAHGFRLVRVPSR
jgi:formylglycine-generating enzyme required for sulfatase activity